MMLYAFGRISFLLVIGYVKLYYVTLLVMHDLGHFSDDFFTKLVRGLSVILNHGENGYLHYQHHGDTESRQYIKNEPEHVVDCIALLPYEKIQSQTADNDQRPHGDFHERLPQSRKAVGDLQRVGNRHNRASYQPDNNEFFKVFLFHL